MAAVTTARTRRVALIGNPNTGKTTLFNQLTGFNARVGNYPGVTVERRVGPLRNCAGAVEVIDLPGTYELAARSVDEVVAVDVLLGRQQGEPAPDLVIVVLDASNPERNLFLASQIMEMGVPMILALNMIDLAERNGIRLDAQLLTRRLGMPVVPVVASRGEGLPELLSLIDMSQHLKPPAAPSLFPAEFEAAARALREELLAAGCRAESCAPFLVRRALLEVGGFAEKRLLRNGAGRTAELIGATRARLREQGHDLVSLESKARYAWIKQQLAGAVDRRDLTSQGRTEKIDGVLVHRFWGTLIFAAIMLLIFQAIYTWSAPFMDMIDGTFAALGGLVGSVLAEGPLRSFLADGVIAGVGGVMVFLPQIVILFLFLAILEDCGYMSRAAVLMDRLLGWCGLSGRSFIPLISSFACNVPGIMATRVIEDRSERMTALLIAPLMSCSARLPVYTLLIGAFVPGRVLVPGVLGLQAVVLFAMYLLGIVVAVPMALLLKKTLIRGGRSMFLMELPEYKRPSARIVFHRVKEQAGEFVVRAGTIIMAVAVIIWALTYYPHSPDVKAAVDAQFAPSIEVARAQLDAANGEHEAGKLAEALEALEQQHRLELQSAWLRDSYLGRAGRLIEPLVKPVGWDWRIGMAVIGSFPAREIVIATLGVIFVTEADDENVASLTAKLQDARWPDGRPLFTLPVALSLMVFFALCAQCAATLAILRRETNSWRWPVFAFAYLTAIAYVAAMVVFRVSTWLLGGAA